MSPREGGTPHVSLAGRAVPATAAIIVCAGLFRVASAFLAFLLNVVVPDYQRAPFTVFGAAHPFWDAFARYDSGWYLQIARFGVQYTPNGRDTIAFFPVYPFLMRHVGRLFGPAPSDMYLGGIVVSWAAFALAMVGLYKLARLDGSPRVAERAVLFAIVFPFAFFFGVVYSEATFLAATVWTFYCFRRRWWLAGGLIGAVATATRVNGIMMWPALAWLVWRDVWGPSARGDETGGLEGTAAGGRRDRAGSVVALALVCAGIAGYSWYVYLLSGNPLEWANTIRRWGYEPGGLPWTALGRLVGALAGDPIGFLAGGGAAPYDTLNGLAGLAFVIATPIVWWRLGASYGLFLAANLWLPLSSGQYEGWGRYCAVLFPVFLLLGQAQSRLLRAALLVGFAMLYVVCLALFVNVYPIF